MVDSESKRTTNKESWLKIFLINIMPIILLLITLVLYFVFYFKEKSNIEQIKNDWSMDVTDVIIWDISDSETVYTGEIEKIKDFSFSETCLIENTWDYKILEVFNTPQKSPTNTKEYTKYTKPYIISWKIQDAKLCIVADVVDYRKKHQYTYSTYIIFWSSDYAWHIRVWYSKNNGVVYDKSSWWTSDLDGRFRWDETPKIYNLSNLNNLKVADTIKWWTKIINIIERLQKQWNIRIWWFVNAKNWEWRINKFILAYKCADWSDCSIE